MFDEHQLEYVLLANGNSDDVHMVGRMAAFQIQNLLVAYKERFDKDNFIKNLLLDNLLLVDIYNRAKKLHIDTEARRVVFILEISNEKENNSLETVRALALPHEHSEAAPVVTLSVGGVSIVPGASDEKSLGATLIALADAALYVAKQQGRNRVVMGGP